MERCCFGSFHPLKVCDITCRGFLPCRVRMLGPWALVHDASATLGAERRRCGVSPHIHVPRLAAHSCTVSRRTFMHSVPCRAFMHRVSPHILVPCPRRTFLHSVPAAHSCTAGTPCLLLVCCKVNVFSSYRSVLCCFSSFFIVGWEAVLRIGSSFVPQIGRKYLHRKFVIS